MLSVPPATTISASPDLMACAASMTDLRPDPQTLFTVVAGTESGRPPLIAAWRAGFMPRPACRMHPSTTSSTWSGRTPARRTASRTTVAPRSTAETSLNAPPKVPTAVRQPERRTTSGVLMPPLSRRSSLGPQGGPDPRVPGGPRRCDDARVALDLHAAHLPPDLLEAPAREVGQVLRLFLLPRAQRHPVAPGLVTGRLAHPRMAQHVPALEVLAVGRLLEDEVLREMLRVVAHVEARDERARPPARHSELPELLRREGVGRARVAPPHVPRVLQHHDAHVLRADLLVEHRGVELLELALDEQRHVHARRDPHGAVVRSLDAPLSAEREHEEVLGPIRVHGAEP